MEFEVGDKVWDVRLGEGVVTGKDDKNGEVHYALMAYFDAIDRVLFYHTDGRERNDDVYPVLYHYGTQLIPAPEPLRCKFKKNDVCLRGTITAHGE